MKYIIFLNEHGRKIPIIFPNEQVHAQIAAALSPILKAKPHSAGEIKIEVLNCSGFSTTLKMGVRKGDANIIHEYDYLFGLPNETGIKVEYKKDKEVLKELFKDDLLKKLEEGK